MDCLGPSLVEAHRSQLGFNTCNAGPGDSATSEVITELGVDELSVTEVLVLEVRVLAKDLLSLWLCDVLGEYSEHETLLKFPQCLLVGIVRIRLIIVIEHLLTLVRKSLPK